MASSHVPYFVREALLTLGQQSRLHAVAIVMISLAVAILTLFLLVMFNARLILQELGEQAKVIVFLDDQIQPAQREAIAVTLRDVVGAQTVDYISKAQAWHDFTTWFPEAPQLLDGLEPHPLPASYVVPLAPRAQSDAVLHTLQQRLSRLPGIDEVEYGTQWRQGFRTVLQSMRLVSLGGGLLLAAGIIFIMANTTRLTLYTRLPDIEIMQLVGATARFISGPFLLIGMIQGLMGTLLGLGLSWGLYHMLLSSLSALLADLVGVQPLRFLPWPVIGGMLMGSLVLGCVGSAFTLNRMLRMLHAASS